MARQIVHVRFRPVSVTAGATRPSPLFGHLRAFLERLFGPAVSNEAQRSKSWGPRIIALILASLAVYLVARAIWEAQS